MEVKTKRFNDHGGAFSKGVSTAGAELFPTDGPERIKTGLTSFQITEDNPGTHLPKGKVKLAL